MDLDGFVQLLRTSLPVGVVLANPGGGTSTVLSHDAERVCYRPHLTGVVTRDAVTS
jgi:hypothetical protein